MGERPTMSERKLTGTATLLATFHVRQALCALDAASVQEVIRFRPPTPIRHAPPEILGVINLRGKIVTLLDLGRILGFGPASAGTESRIFIVEDRGEFLGLLVDSVEGVIEAEAETCGPLPANVPPSQARFFRGVHRSNGHVITLLDASEIFSEGRAT